MAIYSDIYVALKILILKILKCIPAVKIFSAP